jgi:hypothetical protein
MSPFLPFVNPTQIRLSRTSEGDLLLELFEDTDQSADAAEKPSSHRFLLDANARIHLLASLKEALVQPILPSVPRRVALSSSALASILVAPSQPPPCSSATRDLELNFINALRQLNGPFAFERSIQFQSDQIRPGRMLAGYDLRLPSSLSQPEILALLHQLRFPENQLDALMAQLSSSHHLHLGFEPQSETALFKVYLESDCDTNSTSAVRYKAWKYYPYSEKCFTSVYTPLRFSSSSQLCELLMAQFGLIAGPVSVDPSPLGPLVQSLGLIAEQCMPRTATEDLELLYVMEDQSDRQSFDLNLYSSNLYVDAVLDQLLLMCSCLGLDRQRCLLSLQQCLSLPLGHISLGYHRHRQPFFTLYYGASLYV